MRRRADSPAGKRSQGGDVAGALEALDAPALRALVGDLLKEVDEEVGARIVRRLADRAARAPSGWTPAAVADEDVSEILAAVKSAARAGYADPAQVDEWLDRGSRAFLRRGYAAARGIFEAVLQPVLEAEIDLGQHEMVDEVLSADLDVCATQLAVSVYMLSAPEERAGAVRAALSSTEATWYPRTPVADMERVAVEPLPDLAAFLPRWRSLVEAEVAKEGQRGYGRSADWLHEVTARLEGAEGLARMARKTKSDDDYRAWCTGLVEAGDWKGALAAFEEAAERVRGADYVRARYLDGAAAAAERLGRSDVAAYRERAWRAGPTMSRLTRWLGSADARAAVRKRAMAALTACPAPAKRQRGLLDVLTDDLAGAAKLLASAPGLGWSSEEHPGHLLFPLFAAALAGSATRIRALRMPWGIQDYPAFGDSDEYAGDDGSSDDAAPPTDRDEPGLGRLLALAGVDGVEPSVRATLLTAMRKAAERRVDGLTGAKRSRHYDHAAELVAAVVECDPSPETAGWVASLREAYRRFPSMRGALDRRVREG